MNQAIAKKIRKTVNRKVKIDTEEVFKIIAAESMLRRIRYAFKIIFKYKLGEAIKIKE